MNNSLYLARCIKLIEEKLGWGESPDWKNAHFVKLSDKIKTDSGAVVSITTLKRLFGKASTYKEAYIPQEYTRNALVKFLGYENWDEFVEKNPVAEPVMVPSVDTAEANQVPQTRNVNRLLVSGSLLLTVMVGLIFYFSFGTKKFKVVCKNPSGVFPHTATFTYEPVRANDSIYLQIFSEFLPLASPKNTLSYTFLSPGYYQVSVVRGKTRRKVLDTFPIHVLTNGWTTSVDKRPVSGNFSKTGRLLILPEEVRQAGFKQKVYWSGYSNFRDFGVPGDTCTYEVTFRNNASEGGIDCFDSAFEIVGEHNQIFINIVRPGCEWFAEARVGNTFYKRTLHRADKLTKDVSQWSTITINTQQQTVNILLDYKNVFQLKYDKSIGDVKGISCYFKGSGAVDRVFLASGSKIYSEDFTTE